MPNIFTNEQIILTEFPNLKPLSDAEILHMGERIHKMFSNVQILTEFPERSKKEDGTEQ